MARSTNDSKTLEEKDSPIIHEEGERTSSPLVG